ncbi:MAG: response regulator, partial [Desulfobacterales bacterium]
MSAKTLSSVEKTAAILIIGEFEDETRNLADALAAEYRISAAPNLQEAARRLEKETFDAIIYVFLIKGSDLAGILQSLQDLAPATPVIVIGQANDAQLIVGAIKAGAFDFVTTPYPPEKIKLSVHQALEHRSLKNEIDYLRREQDVVYDYDRIIAVSPAMQNVISTIKKLARTDSTILITGETGTGKSF